MGWTFYNSNGQRLSSAATNISVLDIDGATDIGAAIVDADLFIIDDGAGGTNRKTAASRIKTYVGVAVTRKGGNTTEATTTSTGAVELLQATSLDIAATAPFQGFAVLQKTTGHASTASSGWYLGGTRISETVWTSANNGLEGGGWYLQDVARLGNPYEGAGMLMTFSGDGGDVHHHPGATAFEPTGTQDTIGVLGKVANASNTMKADEMQVYDYALS
jgi:hypothetical protein